MVIIPIVRPGGPLIWHGDIGFKAVVDRVAVGQGQDDGGGRVVIIAEARLRGDHLEGLEVEENRIGALEGHAAHSPAHPEVAGANARGSRGAAKVAVAREEIVMCPVVVEGELATPTHTVWFLEPAGDHIVVGGAT